MTEKSKTNWQTVLPEISGEIPGQFREISWTCPGEFPEHSWTDPGHFREISRTFPGQFPAISRKFPGTCPAHFLEFSRTFPGKIKAIHCKRNSLHHPLKRLGPARNFKSSKFQKSTGDRCEAVLRGGTIVPPLKTSRDAPKFQKLPETQEEF